MITAAMKGQQFRTSDPSAVDGIAQGESPGTSRDAGLAVQSCISLPTCCCLSGEERPRQIRYYHSKKGIERRESGRSCISRISGL